MSKFPVHSSDTAPAESRAILGATQKSLGFVPNLFGVFAESPAMLEAYTTLARLQDEKTALSPTERQLLFLTVSIVNGCEYCVAAHTVIAKGQKVPDDVVQSLRRGEALADPRLEALRKFATAAIEQRGWVDAATRDAFFAAGYGARHALEVVLAIAFKTLSNYANHLAGTPLDRAFQPHEWSAARASA